MKKISLHIPQPLQGVRMAPWFTPVSDDTLYSHEFPDNFFITDVERVGLGEAQAVVLPHNFKTLNRTSRAYIQKYAELAEAREIPLYCFSVGDFTDHLRFSLKVHVFRYSLYKSSMQEQDICMPTVVGDFGRESLLLRNKQEIPLVSFCGMGMFRSWNRWLIYFGKKIFYSIRSIFSPMQRARILGVYWRRQAMAACSSSLLVSTTFIIRKTFSGHRKTIELDPAQARKEYIDSIVGSDFVLAPKGDGNYSNRFLETLSFGRIPVLIDTDSVLPLENVIDYSKVIVRVPMHDVANTPRYIRAFYDALTDDEWRARQTLARDTFERYLRQDSFLRYYLSHTLSL